MSNTQTNPTAAPPATITIRVLYNDAITDRSIAGEPSMIDDTGRPYRMSEIDRDTRVQILIGSGAASLPFGRFSGDSSYVPGDPLLEVHTETVDTPANPSSCWVHAQCERVYAILNINQPPGWAHRSMSMGDVVVIGETAWVVEATGFEPADISQSEVL
jgi:hypothetical protein